MTKLIFLICITLIAGILAFGQRETRQRDNSPAKQSKQSDKSLTLDSTASIAAQLQGTIDAKRADVGDQVILKTTKSIKQNGETIIPNGTSLIGRITEVQQRTKENSVSRIGMFFDRIEGKNLDAPISASIVSITNAAASTSIGDSINSDVSGSSSTNAGGSAGSGGGGLLGGVGSTVGGVLNTTTQAVGTVTNTASQAVGTTTGTVGRTINGIQISNSTSGSASSSTMLSSGSKNVRVEKGVTFNLLVNSQASN